MSTASLCVGCGAVLVAGAPFCGACGTRAPISAGPDPVRRATPVVVPAAAQTYPAILPRLLALLIDQALAGLVGGLVLLVVVLVAPRQATAGGIALPSGAALYAPSLLAGLVQVGQWVWEGRTGKTVGNLALHLRTVSVVTGRPAGVGRVLLRQLVQGLGALVCFVGVYVVAASGAWDPSGQRRGWHDKAAGTLVVPDLLLARTLGAQAAAPGLVAALAATIAPAPGPGVAPAPALAPAPIAAPGPFPVPAPVLALKTAPAAAGAVGLISGVPGFTAAVPTTRVEVEPLPDDLDETRLGTGAPSAGDLLGAATYRLTFDTGEIVDVQGHGVVGRNPVPPAGETVVHRVAVPDPARSVSKTHLGFGLDVGGLWIADLGSTNGSAVVGPDGRRVALEAGARAHVTRGTVVEIGDRSFRVELS